MRDLVKVPVMVLRSGNQQRRKEKGGWICSNVDESSVVPCRMMGGGEAVCKRLLKYENVARLGKYICL